MLKWAGLPAFLAAVSTSPAVRAEEPAGARGEGPRRARSQVVALLACVRIAKVYTDAIPARSWMEN